MPIQLPDQVRSSKDGRTTLRTACLPCTGAVSHCQHAALAQYDSMNDKAMGDDICLKKR